MKPKMREWRREGNGYGRKLAGKETSKQRNNGRAKKGREEKS